MVLIRPLLIQASIQHIMNDILKKGSKGEFVRLFQDKLHALGYNLVSDGIFGSGTEKIVLQLQKDLGLKIDGLVGPKTWTIVEEKVHALKQSSAINTSQFLSESDFDVFAAKYQIEKAAVKAVQEVEAAGRGFSQGHIKLLFEGHIFWKELKKQGVQPSTIQAGNENILYPNYFTPNPYYKEDQLDRLNKAIIINEEAAFRSASYGLFQIMGFHATDLGFDSAKSMYAYLSQSESNQLDVFGKFAEKNNLLSFIQKHYWAGFAKRYNGSAYQTNQYDKKLEKAFNRYNTL